MTRVASDNTGSVSTTLRITECCRDDSPQAQSVPIRILIAINFFIVSILELFCCKIPDLFDATYYRMEQYFGLMDNK
nr:MAG TPA: hypothetical protein [Caudoviricetes sp.]